MSELDLVTTRKVVTYEHNTLTHEELLQILGDGLIKVEGEEPITSIKGFAGCFEVAADVLEQEATFIEVVEGDESITHPTIGDYFVTKLSVDGTKAIIIPSKDNNGSWNTKLTEWDHVVGLYEMIGSIGTKSEKIVLWTSAVYTEIQDDV